LTTEQQEQSANPGQERAPESGAPSDILPDQEPSKSQSEKTTGKLRAYLKDFGGFLIKPKTLLEIAALIVVICYTRYAGQQVRTMNDTLEEIRKQTGSSEQAAKAAKSGADTASDTLRLDQRAWLTIYKFELPSEPRMGTPIQIGFFIQNTGRTPALDEYTETLVVSSVTEPKPPSTFKSALHFRNNIITPGTNNTRSTSETWIPSGAGMAAYINKTAKIYIHARINYTDIFEVQHWTSVCAYHTYGDALNSFAICMQGNDVDRYHQK